MRNLDKLGFSRMDLSRAPQLAEVRAKPGTDLKLFSSSLGLSWETFAAHNPAYQRYVSHPTRSTTIYVPRAEATRAQALLIKLPAVQPGTAYAGWKEYKVKRGDTMVAISRKTGVPVADLRRINQISEPLRAGATLKIPGTNRTGVDTRVALASAEKRSPSPKVPVAARPQNVAAPRPARTEAAASPLSHEVCKGDTMYSLARRYGVTQEAILAANGMKTPDLRLGQNLRIPAAGKAVAVAERPSVPAGRPAAVTSRGASRPETARASSDRVVQYTVQSGDTLWAIARKFNVSPVELLALNNMSRESSLRPGDTVKVAVN